jgi:hypothetical protein
VVIVTGISGSGVDEHIGKVVARARQHGHGDSCCVHDVGLVMKGLAQEDDANVNWDRILDTDPLVLRLLRASAFLEIGHEMELHPEKLHIIDLHACFRWYAYLTRGFSPHVLLRFSDRIRCFVNIVENLSKIRERLRSSAWGEVSVLRVLTWRDEELFLTSLLADMLGRVDFYAVTSGQPACTLERLIWHPEVKKVYMSFPITGIVGDAEARERIISFRDKMRQFLVVFDPYTCNDYDETYTRIEMEAMRPQISQTTQQQDFRFIDQADAVVVYYPRRVSSVGVDAEMRHARKTGKTIYLYCPEEPGAGPFSVPVSDEHYRSDEDQFLELLRDELDWASADAYERSV